MNNNSNNCIKFLFTLVLVVIFSLLAAADIAFAAETTDDSFYWVCAKYVFVFIL